MTRDDYSTYVHKVKYIVARKTADWLALSQIGKNRQDYYQLLKILNLYIVALDSYNPPMIIIGGISSGSTSLIPDESIDVTLYTPYINHLVSGEGIAEETRIISVSANEIVLSQAATGNGTGQYIFGQNCLLIADMLCINGHLNKLLGTSFCVDFYVSEFDINQEAIEYTDIYLLTGSSATVLNGSTLYAGLDKTTTWDGEDIDIVYNFSTKYMYFAYPATYADLAHVYDPDGDDVLGAFTQSIVSVEFPDSSIVTYKVYTVPYPTTIPNETYQFIF